MKLSLVPLLGSLHLRYPLYNAISVRDTVAASKPQALALTPLGTGALETPLWQDTPEIALPLAVVPWARARKLPLYEVFEPSPDKGAQADFRRYLEQYPPLRSKLLEVDAAERDLLPLLGEGLTLERIEAELLPRLRAFQSLREKRLEEGPGSDWLRTRTRTMAERILALPYERVTVLASVDHLPFLAEHLREEAELLPTPRVEGSEEARTRSLLDFAFRGDYTEPGNIITKLRELESAEARYHEANILLENGHVYEALQTLEAASQGDFSRPYFLPGYLLARLGQLRDLAGEREGALRAYRAVRALDWVPQEALEAAEAGLETPFEGIGEGDGATKDL